MSNALLLHLLGGVAASGPPITGLEEEGDGQQPLSPLSSSKWGSRSRRNSGGVWTEKDVLPTNLLPEATASAGHTSVPATILLISHNLKQNKTQSYSSRSKERERLLSFCCISIVFFVILVLDCKPP